MRMISFKEGGNTLFCEVFPIPLCMVAEGGREEFISNHKKKSIEIAKISVPLSMTVTGYLLVKIYSIYFVHDISAILGMIFFGGVISDFLDRMYATVICPCRKKIRFPRLVFKGLTPKPSRLSVLAFSASFFIFMGVHNVKVNDLTGCVLFVAFILAGMQAAIDGFLGLFGFG